MKYIFYIIFFTLFSIVNEKWRYRLFLFFLAFNTLPLAWSPLIAQITPFSMFLIFIAASSPVKFFSFVKNNFSYCFPFLLLACYSVIPTVLHREIDAFFNYCLQPLLILYALSYFTQQQEESAPLQFNALIILLLYFGLYQMAGSFGKLSLPDNFGLTSLAETVTPSIWGVGGKFLSYGFVEFVGGHNMLSGMLGIGVLISFSYLLAETKSFSKLVYLALSVVGLLLIFLLTSRAILGGLLFAMVLMIVLVKKVNLKKLILWSAAVTAVVLVAANYMLQFLSIEALNRYLELQDVMSSGNFIARLIFFNVTLFDSFRTIWGVGFNYYYYLGVDDAMLYSFIINGLGFAGLILFLYIVIRLFRHYFKALKAPALELGDRTMIHLGIGLLAYSLIGGFSVTYLWGWNSYSAINWVLLLYSYKIADQVRKQQAPVLG